MPPKVIHCLGDESPSEKNAESITDLFIGTWNPDNYDKLPFLPSLRNITIGYKNFGSLFVKKVTFDHKNKFILENIRKISFYTQYNVSIIDIESYTNISSLTLTIDLGYDDSIRRYIEKSKNLATLKLYIVERYSINLSETNIQRLSIHGKIDNIICPFGLKKLELNRIEKLPILNKSLQYLKITNCKCNQINLDGYKNLSKIIIKNSEDTKHLIDIGEQKSKVIPIIVIYDINMLKPTKRPFYLMDNMTLNDDINEIRKNYPNIRGLQMHDMDRKYLDDKIEWLRIFVKKDIPKQDLSYLFSLKKLTNLEMYDSNLKLTSLTGIIPDDSKLKYLTLSGHVKLDNLDGLPKCLRKFETDSVEDMSLCYRYSRCKFITRTKTYRPLSSTIKPSYYRKWLLDSIRFERNNSLSSKMKKKQMDILVVF